MRLTTDDLGKYVMWNGELAQLVAFGEGQTAHLRIVDRPACEACGRSYEVSVLASSPLFNNSVRRVPTLNVNGTGE